MVSMDVVSLLIVPFMTEEVGAIVRIGFAYTGVSHAVLQRWPRFKLCFPSNLLYSPLN